MNNTQLLIAIGWPTIAVLVAALVNNRQIDMLSRHLDQQIGSLRNELLAGMKSMEEVLDARLTHVEQRLDIR